MKEFLQKCMLFSLVFILSFIALISIIDVARSKMILVCPDVHIVFLGNSQIECSINDSIVERSYNWARSYESPEFVYSKLKLLKRYNPQIDTVFIGFDNVLGFHEDDEEFPYKLCHPFLYDMYSLKDWYYILKNSEYNRWINYFIYPLSWEKTKDFHMLHKSELHLQECKDLGGYLFLTRNALDEHRRRYKYKPHERWHCSKNADYFFRATIDYCQNNNIKVFFLCAPQHREHLQNIDSYRAEYAEKYREIPFYDYVEMELADSCFSDLNHLNYKGARIFSAFFNKQINQKNQ